MAELLKEMHDISIYPDSSYQMSKNALKLAHRLDEILQQLENVEYNYKAGSSDKQYLDEYQRIVALIAEYIAKADQLDDNYSAFVHSYFDATSLVKNKKDKKVEISDEERLAHLALLETGYNEYKANINADFNELYEFAQRRINSGTSLDNYFEAFGAFDRYRLDSLANLENDFIEVKDLSKSVDQSQLLQELDFAEDNHNATFAIYQILRNILENAYVKDELVISNFKKPGDFLVAYNKVVNEYASRTTRINELLQEYKAIPNIQYLESALGSILKFGQFSHKVRLVNQFLELYPHNASFTDNIKEFTNLVAKLDENYEYDKHFSPEKAREVLGNFVLPPEYNPQVVEHYLNPLASLNQIKLDNKQKQLAAITDNQSIKTALLHVVNSRNLDEVNETIASYADDFVNFWANFADSIKPTAGDY